MQLHPPVALAQALDPFLELLGAAPGDGREQSASEAAAGDRRRRAPPPARAPGGALGGLDRGAVIARGLLAGDLVGVDFALRDLLSRLGVGEELDREGGVDREAELQRREHQLRGRAGDERLLGHRAQDQQRLMGTAALGVDQQASGARRVTRLSCRRSRS